MAKLEIDKLYKQINADLTEQIDSHVLQIAKNINRQVGRVNLEFFKILTNAIVDRSGPPGLTGSLAPTWAPLTDAYTKKRYKKYRVKKSSFYRSGNATSPLSTTLPSIDYETVFGTPSVIYKMGAEGAGEVRYTVSKDGVTKGNTQAIQIVGPNGIDKSNLVISLELDAYPVLDHELPGQSLGNKRTNVEELLYSYEPDDLAAAKLSNPGPGRGHHGRALKKRDVLGKFMLWWLKVKLTGIMKEGV